MLRLLLSDCSTFQHDYAGLLASRQTGRDSKQQVAVAEIITNINDNGDKALVDYANRFDQLELPLKVSQQELQQAATQIPAKLGPAIETAITRIHDFHRRQRVSNEDYQDALGLTMGWRWHPIQTVGIYVPGGGANYFSSLIMNLVPATIAGVKEIVVCSPSQGSNDNPYILGIAARFGIKQFFRVGGAQAIAAMALGTTAIPKVDKIFGPGNSWVTEAKRQLFGRVGIDAIAGPSELAILATANQNPAFIASDLLAQAEHDSTCQCLLFSDSADLIEQVKQQLESQLAHLPRQPIAKAALQRFGAAILLSDLHAAVPLLEQFAPEHLQLCLANSQQANQIAQTINNVGSIFVGHNTPEALGDYLAGPNHTLPTSGCARFASGLSVWDFMRRTTWLQAEHQHLTALGEHIIQLANAEGLQGHARSIAIRMPNVNSE